MASLLTFDMFFRFIVVYGEHGRKSKSIKLDNAENNFERKKTDTFVIKCFELGKLSKIRIGHDNSGFGPAWFLDKGEAFFFFLKSSDKVLFC